MTTYDVCIIGGGPSGSAIARRLAQFGYAVVIVEKEVFPRSHVGMSLSPGVHHWLNVLGVEDNLTRATDTVLLWDNDVPVRKENASFHVDRGVFDQMLLNAAVAAGAHLIQPCRQIFLEDNGEWKIVSSSFSFTAKFIVEATGRRSVLKGSKAAYLPPTLAAYAYWDAHIDASYINAGDDCWLWAAPVSRNLVMACIFSDPKNAKDHYPERMKNFSLLYPQLQNCGNVSVCSATAYADEQPVGHNYIKVGDAAFSTDPISAQGVQKALKTAVQGAIVVNTILSGDAAIAMKYYREMIHAEVKKNTQWTRQHYNINKHGEFWQKRKSNAATPPSQTVSIKKAGKLLLNPAAAFASIPIISGTTIEQAKGLIINDEPFVFIQNFPVAELAHALHNKQLIESLHIIRHLIPTSDPMQVLQWLLYNRILINEPAFQPEPLRIS